MRVGVIGHVEHITLGRVPAVPRAGEIAHLEEPRFFPGGGGGIAFFQLTRSAAEVLLYTAVGNDEAAAAVRGRIAATRARIFAAERQAAHTRDLVMITPDGERTIALPWDELSSCDGVYFTAQDPAAITAARAARILVVTARRRPALIRSGVRADVVLGSALDPREACTLDDFPAEQRPAALVLTEGAAGGVVYTAEGARRFPAPQRSGKIRGAYGAGDSFAGALTYYLAKGLPVLEACTRAGHHGAAVLGTLEPLEAQAWLD